MTAVNTTSTSDIYSSLNTKSSTSAADTATATSDRFLKLLVAQMQNQDPLNPMDNAQVTSQMAQINTVTGIDKLNTTVTGLNGQLVQMQALQGASLVGRSVVYEGNTLNAADGKASGMYSIDAAADNVKVEVLAANGRVVDTLNLGAESAGQHSFDWTNAAATANAGLTFRVTATAGAASVTSTALVKDTVTAVNAGGDSLTLELARNGDVAYSKVKTLN